VSVVAPGTLGLGIQLPVQAQSRTFAGSWEAEASPTELANIARAADRAGLLYVAVCDHVAVPRPQAEHMGTTWYDTVATLGYLAGITKTVRLLSHVYVPAYRHPLLTASAFATLDVLSGGRVILGVGAGHLEGEFAALGVDFGGRGARTDEAIGAVSETLTREFPAVEGPTWQFSEAGVGPRPIQSPRPPIWVGGSSPRALRRVAELGDGWLPQGTPLRELPDAINTIHRLREKAGRAGDPLDLGANGPWVHVGETDRELGRGVVSGDPAKIVDVLSRYAHLGISHVQIGVPARSSAEWVDQLEAIGREVIPHLSGEDR
jgi:probable F420-dependent oxidoreductase